LDPAAALALFTAGAARAIGADASLAPGSSASLTVLSGDPMTSDPDRVRRTKVVATWVDGERVHIPDGITTWRG
jgi:predicted amidohydrolase YtcJ